MRGECIARLVKTDAESHLPDLVELANLPERHRDTGHTLFHFAGTGQAVKTKRLDRTGHQGIERAGEPGDLPHVAWRQGKRNREPHGVCARANRHFQFTQANHDLQRIAGFIDCLDLLELLC